MTGIPFAVAAFTSTLSAPTLPSEITLQFSKASMIFLVIGRPLAITASASLAEAINSSSVAASTSIISASIESSDSFSSKY